MPPNPNGFQQISSILSEFVLGDKKPGLDPMPFEKPAFEILIWDLEGTKQIAEIFAAVLQEGDVYYLKGEVGAGKSVFSRSFIRAAYDDHTLPVTSPTFSLVNVYDELVEYPAIHHYDLYRLGKGTDSANDQLDRLKLPQTVPQTVSLFEWPERIHPWVAPVERLEMQFYALSPEQHKQALIDNGVAITEEQKSMLDDMVDGLNDGSYEDNRPRMIRIWPVGPRWRERLVQMEKDEILPTQLTS